MADQPANLDLRNITERIKLVYNEDTLGIKVLAFLIDNKMDIPDQEFTLKEVPVSKKQRSSYYWTDQSSWKRSQTTATSHCWERFKSLTAESYVK